MKIVDFSVGNVILFQGQEYEIKKQLDMGHVLAKNLTTFRDEILPLVNLVSNDPIKTKERLEDISEEDWNEAKRRLAIIKPIIDCKLGKKETIEIAENNQTHFTPLYRDWETE